jgi:hypothetical protein
MIDVSDLAMLVHNARYQIRHYLAFTYFFIHYLK